MKCLLCGASTEKITDLLWKCTDCALVSKNPADFWSEAKEKARYVTHNNDVKDQRYLGYLSKLFDCVPLKKGEFLDYGCGPEKGLEALVEERGLSEIKVTSYDPLFFPDELRSKKFAVVYASECFEHFHKPKQEIEKILSILKPGGVLAISTELYDGKNLENWWYLRDPTHVIFYSRKTFKWIESVYKLNLLELESPHIILKTCGA